MRGKIQKLHKGAYRFDKSTLLKAALLLTALAGLGILFNQYLHRYDINPDQAKLLSRVSVNTDNITQDKGKISYSSPKVAKNQTHSVVTSSAADSTGSLLYNADFNNNGGLIKFSDSKGDLSFIIKPLQSSGSAKLQSGRVVYASTSGPKSVYTLKRNGIKGDILLNKSPGNTFTKSWQLNLGSNLTARVLANGSIGIYSANPYLFGDLTISDSKSQKLIDNARKNGAKDNLVFVLPAPYLVESNAPSNYRDVKYHLDQDILTLTATNLDQQTYPLSIDPSVVVTTTADFRTGKDDGNMDYSVSGEIDRGNISVGTIGTFTTNTNYFATPRRAPRLIAYNGYMYMLGGWQYGDVADTNCKNTGSGLTCNDVQYAVINSGGDLGTWANTTYMPMGRNGGGVQAYNGYLYIIGGSEGPSDTNCKNTGIASNYCNDTIYALICTGSNSGVGGCGSTPGTVGTWNTNSTYFSIPRTSLSSAISNGYMYILGGVEGASNTSCKNAGTSNACNDIQYAKINADGSLGSWTINTTYFTTPRSEQGTVAYNNFLYVVGGQDPSLVDYSDIQYAPINADGSVGAWTTNAVNLLENHETFGVTASNGYLYYIAGFNNLITTGCPGGNCKAVDYAPIYANGSTGTWTESTNYLPSNRQDFGLTTYNGRLYVGGGTTGSGTSSTCKSPTFTSSNCDDVVYVSINTGNPTFGTDGTWNFTSSNTNNGSSFSAGFTTPRHSQASIAYNGYLYILGGLRNTASNDCSGASVSFSCKGVQYAPINSDGTIGAWNYTASGNTCSTWISPCNTGFTAQRYAFAAVAYNGYLYILGGHSTSSANDCTVSSDCNGVQFAPFNSDGTIGAWHYTHDGIDDGATFVAGFMTSRQSLASVAYNGYLYIAGGSVNGSAANDCTTGAFPTCNGVQFAPINSDGTIGAWHYTSGNSDNGTTFTAGFTQPRGGHSIAAYNGYMYLVGGEANVTGGDCTSTGFNCNGVQFAPINSNGTIGAWHYTSASTDNSTTFSAGFIQPRWGHTTVTYNGYMYVIGGQSGASGNDCTTSGFNCKGVQYAPINANGTIGVWHYTHAGVDDSTTFSTGFATPRGSHSTAVYKGYMYVIGGSNGADPTGNDCSNNCNGVQYASLNSAEQAATYEKIIDIGSLNTIQSLSFNGTSVCGDKISYRIAGTNGVFGAVTNIPNAVPGITYSINQSARYVIMQVVLNDAVCGSKSSITDITVNYTPINSAPVVPTLITPAANATNVLLNPVFTLRTTDADNDYLKYRINFYQSDCSTLLHTIDQSASQVGWTGQDQALGQAYTGNSVLSSSTIATHTYQFGDLSQINTYCWNAAAIDTAGSNTWSTNSSSQLFTTIQTSGVQIKSGTTIKSGVTIH